MKKLLYTLFYIFVALLAVPTSAQRTQWSKLSPWLRQIVRQQSADANTLGLSRQDVPPADQRQLIAFVRVAPDGHQALADCQARSLACFGSIHIASIPLSQVGRLSADRRVLCIEASPNNHLCTDSMAIHLNALNAYAGVGLPQAYTGQGVVMGIMDVGFDLTHPNFYSRDLSDYRIRRFWDQISQDTIGSPFPVGRDFTTASDILAIAHSRDGLDLTHGTHTLGIAAGSGYDSPYRGMAPEADICLVANAVTDDLVYIDSADVYKYTYATDALGFKYIFDYATSVGKPCVISFSEGSPQDFFGYDQLYYEILDSLTGPGRILVAAAGNEGHRTSWIHKPRGQQRAGTFVSNGANSMLVVLKSADDFTLRAVAYNDQSVNDTLAVSLFSVLQQPDSIQQFQLGKYQITIGAYPSCYNERELCYDLLLSTEEGTIGANPQLSIELIGAEADVELWRASGRLVTSSTNPLLADGEATHCVHSPSSAPCVISVGENSYRDFIVNLRGDTMSYWPGTGGVIVQPSSRGPTMDGRIKPDCVAPGNNIISSYSSFYLENHPTAGDILWDVAHFPFQGRTYAWNSNSGTSMAAPAVGGAIALWLQACPTLSPTEVMGILQRTARHCDPLLDYPNNTYGHGEIDVYAGLLDLLGLAAIDDFPKVHSSACFRMENQQMNITLPQPPLCQLPLSIYSLGGQVLFRASLPAGQVSCTLSLPPFSAGIYAVSIGKESTLVRLGQ